ELREEVETFPVSQDQRNTLSATLRYEPHSRVWFAVRTRYGSGLPFELADDDDDDENGEDGEEDFVDEDERFAEIPAELLDRVNLLRGRVRPNFSLDFSIGAELWRRNGRSLNLQLDAVNVTDQLNVINFSGLFSGTALAPTRMFGVKL